MSEQPSLIAYEFQKLTAAVNGELTIFDDKYGAKLGGVHMGAFEHAIRYTLKYPYQNCEIRIEHSLGLDNMGEIEFVIPNAKQNFEFEVKTLSIIRQLWNKKKSPLEIFSNNSFLNHWIKENPAFEQLCFRARKDRFEPSIIGRNTAHGLHVKCMYSLVFNNYELSIAPFAEFFNDLIDLVQSNN